ncbi:hypothetical protein [Tunicatimonas pelagia]|uniref:hypothetical protein n=1 Tax=Tunicatimonas pelagia TaxID=931531 RepID=UPI0026652FA3|nr:hypothetical protein [Tunicatimonas pelagia]WKN42492.1 hypothetical protein P0M28_25995 [Tunicatimonas pelagia]
MLKEVTVTACPAGSSRVSSPDHKIAEKAITFYYAKKYKKAARFLDELIRRNPFHPGLYKMRAHSRYVLGDNPGACEDYQKIQTLLHKLISPNAQNICANYGGK